MHEDEYTKEIALSGTAVSAVTAAGAAVLSIIGLAGILPVWMVTIATIALGASFLLEGAAIVARTRALVHEVTEGKTEMAELGTGMGGETLAGLAGITLGILGLVGVVPAILISCAAIVFGAALVIGAGANIRINDMAMEYRAEHPMVRRVVGEAVKASSGLQVLAGLGAITLGILALIGIVPLTLSLVAMLAVGVMFLLSNAAVASRMATMLHH